MPTELPAIAENMLMCDLPCAWVSSFLNGCVRKEFPVHETLFSQGNPCEYVAMIETGEVEVSVRDLNGQETVLHCAGAGEVLGDIEASAQLPALATCRALPGSAVQIIPASLFQASLGERLFARNFARIVYQRMSFVNEVHSRSKYLPVEARICACLVTLSRNDPVIRRSQSYIAEMVGCSRQTVNRCLGELRDDNIVSLRKGVIEILDREALTKRWA